MRRCLRLIKELRRGIEALRGQDKLLRRQAWGDDTDVDAQVEVCADVRLGWR